MKLSVRTRIAIGLWLMCIFTLASGANLEPIIGWRGWLAVGWVFVKIALFGYAGFLLLTADEEIETLKASNKSSERFIAEILKQVNCS